ncbi:MAG TPA: ribosome silencing factor [Steroidobacteraceae bacterium]
MAEKRAKTVRAAKSARRKSAVGSRAPMKAPSKTAKTNSKVATLPRRQKREALLDVVRRALDDMKAVNVRILDVRKLTDIADTMIIASGNSDRHVRSIADRVVEFAKKAGYRPMGIEGEREGEWVLVDLQDVIVHVMLPRVREFYRLESLWDVRAARREAAGE